MKVLQISNAIEEERKKIATNENARRRKLNNHIAIEGISSPSDALNRRLIPEW